MEFISVSGCPGPTLHFLAGPGSALRHSEVANFPEVADSVNARTCPQKTVDIDSHVDHHSLLSIRVSIFKFVRLVTVTCSTCRTPDLLERVRAEIGGADQWVLKRREFLGFARVVLQVYSCIFRIPTISFQ